MGVNNFGTNMLSKIGVKIGTRAPENMKASRHPHGETFLRRMASSSAKLDPVQVRKKESGNNLTILILDCFRRHFYLSLASLWMKMTRPWGR